MEEYASPELRKELEVRKSLGQDYATIISVLKNDNDRLTQSNKELVEELEILKKRLVDSIFENASITNSKKELLVALTDTVTRMTRARNIINGESGKDWQILNASIYEDLIENNKSKP